MDTINEFNFFKQYLYFVTISSFFYIYIYICENPIERFWVRKNFILDFI